MSSLSTACLLQYDAKHLLLRFSIWFVELLKPGLSLFPIISEPLLSFVIGIDDIIVSIKFSEASGVKIVVLR